MLQRILESPSRRDMSAADTVRAWVGVGGNLGDVPRQFAAALDHLLADGTLALMACSSLYRTEPWGRRDQPDFLNAVVVLAGETDPESMLRRLQAAEVAGGRRREATRWAPRPIDLDLLAFGGVRLRRPGLELPHPRAAERAFVLVPLVEVGANVEVAPGVSAAAALARLSEQERAGVQCIGAFRYPLSSPDSAASR